MAKFYVGQRVRIARSRKDRARITNPHPCSPAIGTEAVVAGTISRPNAGFFLAGDSDTSIHVPSMGATGMVPAYTLEPIIPNGHKAGDFANVRDLLRSLCDGAPA